MKKLILTIFALTLLNASFAQFNRGRMLAGGSVGFSSTTDKATSGGSTATVGTTTSISFGPSFGYFVMDNLAVGASINYSSSDDKGSGSFAGYETKSTALSFGPFVRYYFVKSLFGQGSFGVGSSKDDFTSSGSTSSTKYTISSWSLGVGYAIFLNDNVAIEPMLRYQSQSEKSDASGNPKDVYSGIGLSVGFQVYLGERK